MSLSPYFNQTSDKRISINELVGRVRNPGDTADDLVMAKQYFGCLAEWQDNSGNLFASEMKIKLEHSKIPYLKTIEAEEAIRQHFLTLQKAMDQCEDYTTKVTHPLSPRGPA